MRRGTRDARVQPPLPSSILALSSDVTIVFFTRVCPVMYGIPRLQDTCHVTSKTQVKIQECLLHFWPLLLDVKIAQTG